MKQTFQLMNNPTPRSNRRKTALTSRLIFVVLAILGGPALAQSTAPKLLPFQGRLTDQNGMAVSNGVRLVQFKIFDVPAGGSPVWAGELHRTTVNGGLVNVMMGTKTPFTDVDFDRQLYLEITVDINGDNAITLADPPMLPRQAILPVVFAKEAADSRKLNGYDWTPVFGINDPTISLPASKLADGSLPATKLQAASITSNQIAPQSLYADLIAPATITATQIAPNTITSNQIANGMIDVAKLAQQVAEALNPPGAIVAYGGDTIPAGWLLCDGSMKSMDVYPRLWQAVGERWGAKSGSEFRLPDLRGVFLRGVTGSRGDMFRDPDVNTRAGLFGSASVQGVGSYQPSVFEAHFHGTAINTPFNNGSSLFGTGVRNSTAFSNPDALMFAAGNGISLAQNSERVGGNETRPSNAAVNYLIKY